MPGVLGFVGQSMSGQKKAITAVNYSYPTGSYTFTVPKPGIYRFVLWGAGGGGGTGGGERGGASGAFVIAERPLGQGSRIALVVGDGGLVNAAGGDTTVTLPDGEVLTAGGGSKTTVGAATGKANRGDVLLAGSLGGVAAGSAGTAGLGDAGGAAGTGNGSGGGAPGNGGYRGGAGGDGGAAGLGGQAPGGGTGYNPSAAKGGGGLIIITQVRIRR